MIDFDTSVETELREHGVYASVTTGTSMQPLFKTHRDMIIVKSITEPLVKYDVALYRGATGKYILHRVVGVRDDVYLIRGDNTFTLERVPKDRVIGVLTEFNRKGKRHSVNDMGYCIYSRLWNFIYPIRFLWNFGMNILRAIYRKPFKRNSKKG